MKYVPNKDVSIIFYCNSFLLSDRLDILIQPLQMLTRPILITQESLKLHNARNDCVKLRTPVTRKFHRSTEDEQRPICVHCLGTKSYSLHYRMLWQILYQRFSTWVSGVSKETGSLCFCLLILSFYGMPSKYFAVELFRQYVCCDW